jgi:hypothetical protein
MDLQKTSPSERFQLQGRGSRVVRLARLEWRAEAGHIECCDDLNGLAALETRSLRQPVSGGFTESAVLLRSPACEASAAGGDLGAA